MDKTIYTINNDTHKIIGSFDISQQNSNKLCLMDPMILIALVFLVFLLFYIISYKLNYHK